MAPTAGREVWRKPGALIMIALIGGLLLKATLGTTLEATAGRFVTGRLFGPFVMLLAAGGLYLGVTQGVPAMVRAHDARVAKQAGQQITTAIELELERAKAAALEEALNKSKQTLSARESELEVQSAVLKDLEEEKRNARQASPNGSAVVVPADDPWLRPKRR